MEIITAQFTMGNFNPVPHWILPYRSVKYCFSDCCYFHKLVRSFTEKKKRTYCSVFYWPEHAEYVHAMVVVLNGLHTLVPQSSLVQHSSDSMFGLTQLRSTLFWFNVWSHSAAFHSCLIQCLTQDMMLSCGSFFRIVSNYDVSFVGKMFHWLQIHILFSLNRWVVLVYQTRH